MIFNNNITEVEEILKGTKLTISRTSFQAGNLHDFHAVSTTGFYAGNTNPELLEFMIAVKEKNSIINNGINPKYRRIYYSDMLNELFDLFPSMRVVITDDIIKGIAETYEGNTTFELKTNGDLTFSLKTKETVENKELVRLLINWQNEFLKRKTEKTIKKNIR